jgi:hypothetical protein
MATLIDRRTGRELHSGDTLIRRDYKGFKHRYELLELNVGTNMVRVRKLLPDDRWVYLIVPIASLQLEAVML